MEATAERGNKVEARVKLTTNQMLDAIKEGRRRQAENGAPLHHQQAYEANALCDSQLRNVVEGLDEARQGRCPLTPEDEAKCSKEVPCITCKTNWYLAHLRAAVRRKEPEVDEPDDEVQS